LDQLFEEQDCGNGSDRPPAGEEFQREIATVLPRIRVRFASGDLTQKGKNGAVKSGYIARKSQFWPLKTPKIA
jgi:hypothetical protein